MILNYASIKLCTWAAVARSQGVLVQVKNAQRKFLLPIFYIIDYYGYY